MVDEPFHGHEEELREGEKVSALWLCSKKNFTGFQNLIYLREKEGEWFLTLQ